MNKIIRWFSLVVFISLTFIACNKCKSYKNMVCEKPDSEQCKQVMKEIGNMSSDQCDDAITGLKAVRSFDDSDFE